MSGIAGIFDRSGMRVERALLDALTRFLSYRGPDGRATWTDGCVGLGHTLLRTTPEARVERQPMGLDGRWITADVRLDCRQELQARLEREGRKIGKHACDPELILHAYAAWGERCVEHLRGDFAFAIWDARRRELFCARDHFGTKPFYYAEIGDQLLFSNTLDCVRLHPDVSAELNEGAIADFLLFGLNCDTSTTTFRQVLRIPPSHCLAVSSESLRIWKYWTPPIDGRIRYGRADDYVEHFQELLHQAVADRIRTSRAGILLSGGLDSGAIAAAAVEASTKTGDGFDLRAYTLVYESLIGDTEGEFARSIAEFLGIPLRSIPLDHLELFERWDDAETALPEPVDDPFVAGLFHQFRTVGADCRVVLCGDGGDNLMHFQMLPYVKDLARHQEWVRLLREVAAYLHLRPSFWPGIRRRAKALVGQDGHAAPRPGWLREEFARRVSAAERWEQWSKLSEGFLTHPVVPEAHASLRLPHWPHLFELEDPGVTRCTVEVRNPLLDLRIVEYLLAIPPFPWAFEKRLLRESLVGRLPEKVRTRPKTPLRDDPLLARLKQPRASWLDQIRWSEEAKQYVDPSRLGAIREIADSGPAGSRIRALCLNFWLQTLRSVRYNFCAEAGNG
jgi:asparagine synthase (glutamine-hydrolysing)